MSKGDISKGEHAVRGVVIQSPLSLSLSLSLFLNYTRCPSVIALMVIDRVPS